MSTPSTFFLRRRQHLGKRRLVAWLIGATLVLQVAVSTLQAAEGSSPYDLLGRVLVPWVAILASEREADAARALTVAARVEASQGFPVDATGQRAEFSLEYPDKLRLHVPFWCEHFTVARRGELLWVAPGSRLKALLARPEVAKRLPEPDRKFKLAPFRLPLTAKEMAFLPALFQVREMAPQPLEGTTCRVLDLQLTALLSKSVAIAGWVGATVGKPAGPAGAPAADRADQFGDATTGSGDFCPHAATGDVGAGQGAGKRRGDCAAGSVRPVAAGPAG